MRTSRMATALIGLAALIAASALTAAAWSATKATTVTVTAGKPTEFGFKLSTKTVKHGAVTFKVTNSGAIPHDFKIAGTQLVATRVHFVQHLPQAGVARILGAGTLQKIRCSA